MPSRNNQLVGNSGRIVASWRAHSFTAMWLFIIAVSVYDGFCVVASRATIGTAEHNPIGRWLVRANSGDIWLLLAAKASGTVVAATALLWLHSIRPHLGWIVCINVALFQLMLLGWLIGG
jgi:hypothetical protein